VLNLDPSVICCCWHLFLRNIRQRRLSQLGFDFVSGLIGCPYSILNRMQLRQMWGRLELITFKN
jgi:hypothetical protein